MANDMEIGWENILADCGSDSVLKLKAECSRQERVFHRPEMRGVATSQAPLLTCPPVAPRLWREMEAECAALPSDLQDIVRDRHVSGVWRSMAMFSAEIRTFFLKIFPDRYFDSQRSSKPSLSEYYADKYAVSQCLNCWLIILKHRSHVWSGVSTSSRRWR